ncbi:MAG TPA: MBL fold metallo-hydrolase [Polyangia bacterium]|nr:MBL fold metallo-hydrolase [Polyangia bacterium]
MRVHHLNCATMCPPFVGKMVCHVLAIETPSAGVVLVDTGLGTGDVATPKERLGREFVAITRPRLQASETAVEQLEQLGFAPKDVRHVVVTHLDLDHAGGLADFPDAAVHVSVAEHDAAMNRRTARERNRYRPPHWAHGPKWAIYTPGGERWNGFDGVRALDGLPPEILRVPLVGHTRGHHGIAIRRAGDAGWMLHAGDAYFHHGEMETTPRCPLPLRAFQKLVAIDDESRLANQSRLRTLARDALANVTVFSAHDPHELDQLRAAH